jgi:hypothetical protein
VTADSAPVRPSSVRPSSVRPSSVRPSSVRPSYATASQPVILGLVLLAGAVSLLTMALATSDQPVHAVVWGGLSLAAGAAGFMCLISAGRGPGLGLARWRIGSWTLLWYGVAFGLASITFAAPQTGIAAQIALTSVLRALWVVGAGLSLWVLGYLAGPGRGIQNLAGRGLRALGSHFSDEVRSPAAPWLLYAIGSAARVVTAVTSGHFGYVGDAASAVSTATSYGQVLALLSLCAPLAVAAAALQVFGERVKGARLTLAVLFLAELGVGAASGNKQSYITVLLAVAIPYSAARRRLPKTAIVFGIAVFLLIVIPFTAAYRNAARGGQATLTTSQAISSAPAILRQTVSPRNIETAFPASTAYLLQRIREIDSPAIIVQRTPQQIGFQDPAQLVEGPLAALVPRAIWADKPIMATGYTFNEQYYDSTPTVYTSAASTPVGSLYQYGGWIPVLAGMLVLGSLVRLMDDSLDIYKNPHAVLLVLLLLPNLVKSEAGWVDLIASIPGTIVIWLFACVFTFRARRPG